MTHSLLARAGALMLPLSVTVALAACTPASPASPTPTAASSASASSAPATSATSSGSSASATATTPAVDGHTLTGPGTVPLTPEVSPITTDPKPALPVTTTGADGVQVTVSDISRIVPLDIHGTFSQTLIGLGLAKNVVGRTSSDEEPSLSKAPNVTQGGHNLNLESLLALHPSLVLTDKTIGSVDTIGQLRGAGITVLVLSSERRADLIAPQITTLGKALGLDDVAQKLVDRTQKRLGEVQQEVARLSSATKPALKMVFLYVRGNAGVFFIFGKGSGADDLITSGGGDDVATKAGLGDTVPATADALLKLNPDVIVCMTAGLASTGGVDGMVKRPGVGQTTAGQNKRIIDIADGDALSFGPSYPETVLNFAKVAYGAAQ